MKEGSRLHGFDLPDPITMAVALDPAVATKTIQVPVRVEIGDGLCRGQMLLDHLHILGARHHVDVVIEADRARFIELLRLAVSA